MGPIKKGLLPAGSAHPFTTWPDLPETSEFPGDLAEFNRRVARLSGSPLPESATAR